MPVGFFAKDKLPDPLTYYQDRLANLSKPNSKGWALTNCVFHQPDVHPSLSVNVQTGAFLCFSCGAKGGDIIDFHRLLTGEDFPTACKSLGCWEFTL